MMGTLSDYKFNAYDHTCTCSCDCILVGNHYSHDLLYAINLLIINMIHFRGV